MQLCSTILTAGIEPGQPAQQSRALSIKPLPPGITAHTWIDIVYTNHKTKGWFKRRFWTCDPDHLGFAAAPSSQDLAIFMTSHSWVPFKRLELLETALQQLPASCLEHSPDFPRACTPWKSLPPNYLADMRPQQSPPLVFLSSPIQVLCRPNVLNFSLWSQM